MAELLIKGGMVIDGTGNAGYEADVFVKDGKNIGILNRKEFEYLLSET